MAVFKYRAISKDGKINSAQMEAASINEAKSRIKDMNLTPIEIEQVKEKFDSNFPLSSLSRFRSRKNLGYLKVDVLSHFCRQLSVIMDSGINTIKGLQVLKMQIPDKKTQ
jgi:type IV pilus assembly protein PilC